MIAWKDQCLSPNIIDQSSCGILTTYAKTRPILHDDWSIRLGENRPDKTLKHLATMLLCTVIFLTCIYIENLIMLICSYVYIRCIFMCISRIRIKIKSDCSN